MRAVCAQFIRGKEITNIGCVRCILSEGSEISVVLCLPQTEHMGSYYHCTARQRTKIKVCIWKAGWNMACVTISGVNGSLFIFILCNLLQTNTVISVLTN